MKTAKPFQSVDKPKTTLLRIRATPADKELIEQKAADCGLTTAEFLRKVALGRQTRTQIDLLIINEIREVAQSLRELHSIAGGIAETEFQSLLKECIQAMLHVGNRESSRWDR